MGAKIDGFRQGVRYGSSSETLWFRLKQAGADVTSPTGTPTVTFYSPAGVVIGSANSLTQDGTTGWYSYALDASSTGTWELGEGYRAELSWVSGGITYKDHAYLDVCKWPINEPLVTSTEIEELYPAWTEARPTTWSTWATAILKAHKDLMRDLRDMRDNRGRSVYVHRILDRDQLKTIEEAYIHHHIVVYVIESDEDDIRAAWSIYNNARQNIGSIIIDSDDDLVKDDGEEVSIEITWGH